MITSPRPRISETDIARPIMTMLDGHGFTVRTEVPVTLNGQQVYADILGVKADPDGDRWIIVEAKRVLCRELIVQCERWRGLANQIVACVHEPRHRRPGHEKMRNELAEKGIGLVYINVPAATATISIKAGFNAKANVAVIAAAFRLGPAEPEAPPPDGVLPGFGGLVDPPAGSPSGGGALRMTEKRNQWSPATEWLRANPGGWTWKWIARECGMEHITPAQAAKAVRKRDWQGVKIDSDGGRTTFYAKFPEAKE